MTDIRGTSFDRPSFRETEQLVESGKVETVIVKNMSRLDRNYLQVGMYTDIVFPKNDVRFIAVNDNADSAVQTEFDMSRSATSATNLSEIPQRKSRTLSE